MTSWPLLDSFGARLHLAFDSGMKQTTKPEMILDSLSQAAVKQFRWFFCEDRKGKLVWLKRFKKQNKNSNRDIYSILPTFASVVGKLEQANGQPEAKVWSRLLWQDRIQKATRMVSGAIVTENWITVQNTISKLKT